MLKPIRRRTVSVRKKRNTAQIEKAANPGISVIEADWKYVLGKYMSITLSGLIVTSHMLTSWTFIRFHFLRFESVC